MRNAAFFLGMSFAFNVKEGIIETHSSVREGESPENRPWEMKLFMSRLPRR